MTILAVKEMPHMLTSVVRTIGSMMDASLQVCSAVDALLPPLLNPLFQTSSCSGHLVLHRAWVLWSFSSAPWCWGCYGDFLAFRYVTNETAVECLSFVKSVVEVVSCTCGQTW